MNSWIPYTLDTVVENGDLIKLDYTNHSDVPEGESPIEICVVRGGWLHPIDTQECHSHIADVDYADIIEFLPVLPRVCGVDFTNHPNSLPDGFIKKPSVIHGEGIFTTYDWPCNTFMIVSHLLVNDAVHRNGGVGSYINHADNPNCRIDFEGSYGKLTSISKIKAGDELTLDYRVEACGKGVEVTCKD